MSIEQRKRDHIDLCATDDVRFRGETTLLEGVHFEHNSLPELSHEEIDLSVTILGKKLRLPLFVSGMTGGTEKATKINHLLARMAEAHGIGFGVGSQRAMAVSPALGETFKVRQVAPTTLLLGNIGVVQARTLGLDALKRLVADIGADAFCVHLNPAMELIQTKGDRDFRGGYETVGSLVRELDVPVVVKETGCGMSETVLKRLRDIGVEHVDVAGAGGTSWVGVETLRATSAEDARKQKIGTLLWDWGVPTAVSTHYAAKRGFKTVISSGGIQNGLDVARAIRLGASACGIARRFLQLALAEDEGAIAEEIATIEETLRAICVLTGSRSIKELSTAPARIRGELHARIAANPVLP